MQSKPPHCLGQRALCFGQLPAYLCQQLPVDAVDQPDENVIKNGKLVGCQAVGLTHEKLHNLTKEFGPPFGGPSIYRVQIGK